MRKKSRSLDLLKYFIRKSKKIYINEIIKPMEFISIFNCYLQILCIIILKNLNPKNTVQIGSMKRWWLVTSDASWLFDCYIPFFFLIKQKTNLSLRLWDMVNGIYMMRLRPPILIYFYFWHFHTHFLAFWYKLAFFFLTFCFHFYWKQN